MSKSITTSKEIMARTALLKRFFEAGERSDFAAIQRCLDLGIKVNDKLDDNSLLHVAANNGDANFIRKFLKRYKGVEIDIRGSIFNLTPLHIGTQSEQFDVCEMLLRYGANVNATDNNRQGCLHFAVKVHNIDLVKLFFRYKVIVNVCDVYYQTPLSMAVIDLHNYDMAVLLLSHHADVNFPRSYNPPLLHEAVLNAPHRNYLRFIQLLIDNGANPNEVDNNGRTPMHYAAIKGNVELVSFFTDLGCDLLLKDVTGKTVIEIAKMHEHKELVMFLHRTQQTKTIQFVKMRANRF